MTKYTAPTPKKPTQPTAQLIAANPALKEAFLRADVPAIRAIVSKAATGQGPNR
jgi:hypothetical protein